MAQLNHKRAPDGCTSGERFVFAALQHVLPDDYFVWFEPTLYGKKMCARPDFVILGSHVGLIIVEVKDWSIDGIHSANRDTFEIYQGQQIVARTNPEKQLATHRYALHEEIERYQGTNPDKYQLLIHASGAYRGKLAVPISTVVAFPNITHEQWQASILELYHILNEPGVLFREDFRSGLADRLLTTPVFQANLSQQQIETIKWMIYPEVRVPYTQDRLLDPEQINLARSDTYLPPEALSLSQKPQIKLVRGAVGSGKSLILLNRAKFISEQNENWRVLVLTYNKSLMAYLRQVFRRIGGNLERVQILNFHKWCTDLLESCGTTLKIMDESSQRGLIQSLLNDTANRQFTADFLAEEFNWIKERLSYSDWANYLDSAKVKRTGRGRNLGGDEAQKRRDIYDLFGRYQQRLEHDHSNDWADVPVKVMEAIHAGRIPAPQYHAILIDEAQDFSPSWFRVVFEMIKPETKMLFIVGDGAQRIYRQDFTWKELGLAVTAHNSYVLTRCYRSTREIVDFALDLVRDSPTIVEELRSAGDGIVEPEQTNGEFRHGPLPVLLSFDTPEKEYEGIANEIRSLFQQGFLPRDIAILQRSRERTDRTVRQLSRQGISCRHFRNTPAGTEIAINVCTFHSAKGLEFEIVFVCGLDELQSGEGEALAADELRLQLDQERKLLYVGLTRARKRLYITYSGIGPEWLVDRLQSKIERLRQQ